MSSPDSRRPSSAACVLADGGDPDALARLPDLVSLLEAASLAPIVAVVPQGTPVPAPARAVVAASRRPDATTAMRWGLTQLANALATGALLVPVGAAVRLPLLLAVLDAAHRSGAMLVRGDVAGDADTLAWVHRDAWRDLLTAADGLAAVERRYGAVRVPDVELPPPV